MLFALTTVLIAVASANPLQAEKPSQCSGPKITPVILSISSNHPHPSFWCSSYLSVPDVTVLTTVTDYKTTATRFETVPTTTTVTGPTTTYVDVTTVVSYVPTGSCVSGSVNKRAAEVTRFAPSLVSSACSCIGPATGTVTESFTTRPKATTSTVVQSTVITNTVYPTTTTTSTYAIEIWATQTTPFKMQVTNFTPGHGESSGEEESMFLDCPPGCIGNNNPFASETETEFILTNCNELVIVQADAGNTVPLGTYLTDDEGYPEEGDSLFFAPPSEIQGNGWYVWSCSIDPSTQFVSCVDGDNVDWGSYYGYAELNTPDFSGGTYFGSLDFVAVYQN